MEELESISRGLVMKIEVLSSRGFWAATSLLVIAQVVLFNLRIISSPQFIQVQYIPDDGYYYLMLSKSFASTGLWTFDSGVSTTTGFHPLFAYSLSMLHRLLGPTIDQFVVCGLVIGSLLTAGFSLIAWATCLKHRKPYLLGLLALMISSSDFAYNSVSVTEWPLVLLFASLYSVYFFGCSDAETRRHASILFMLGLLGSWCRSDFGLLPLSICAATILFSQLLHDTPKKLSAISGLAGSILGLLLLFVHNYSFSGNFLQSSVKMKAYWGKVYGISYLQTIGVFSKLIFGVMFDLKVLLILAASIFVMALCYVALVIKKRQGLLAGFGLDLGVNQRSLELVLISSSLLCMTGYVFIYAFNSAGLQPWYSASFMVPLFVVIAAAMSFVDAKIQSSYRRYVGVLASLAVLWIVTRNVYSIHRDLGHSPWPHQRIMLEAAQYLRQQTLDGKIASWNAGILGYYQGGNVINIDGLVNDDIHDYAISNQLPLYLSRQKVKYIIDFAKMISVKSRRQRGGYDDEHFLARLQPMKVFDDGHQSEWKYLTLYRLLP